MELANATALVPAYNPELFRRCVPEVGGEDGKEDCVVFICCGGVKIGLEDLVLMEKMLEAEDGYKRACVDEEKVVW